MKIQLKRSNVLENGKAKEPTSAQMEYGELAVNYNSNDPVIFIKDSSNGIIRLTDLGGDGEINVNAGDGLTASGDNATANQEVNTTRVLTVNPEPGKGISVSAAGVRVAPDDLAGSGLTVDGDKLTVDLEAGGGITIDNDKISVDVSNIINEDDGLKVVDGKISVDVTEGFGLAIVNGSIQVVPGDLVDENYGIEATTDGLRLAGSWVNIPQLPATA